MKSNSNQLGNLEKIGRCPLKHNTGFIRLFVLAAATTMSAAPRKQNVGLQPAAPAPLQNDGQIVFHSTCGNQSITIEISCSRLFDFAAAESEAALQGADLSTRTHAHTHTHRHAQTRTISQTFSQGGINQVKTHKHRPDAENRRGTKQDLPLRHCLEGEWGNTLVLRGC